MSGKYGNGTMLYNTGIINEPKYSHLTKLFNVLLQNADAIVGSSVPNPIPLKYWNGTDWIIGTDQIAHSKTDLDFLSLLIIYSSLSKCNKHICFHFIIFH